MAGSPSGTRPGVAIVCAPAAAANAAARSGTHSPRRTEENQEPARFIARPPWGLRHPVAGRVGVSITNLSLLKTGKVKGIRFSTLEAICRELECQPADLLEYVPDFV